MLQAVAGNATLGRYTLLRRLAVGGMGEIFIARRSVAADADRLVVVKRLLRDPIDDGRNGQARLASSIKCAGKLATGCLFWRRYRVRQDLQAHMA